MTSTSPAPPARAVPWDAWAPDRTTAVRSRGLRLEVCDWGDLTGAAAVVLCAHGYLDCAATFGGLAALLVEQVPGLAVRAFSFAGHGGSDHAGAYAWTDHTADLLAVLAATRRERPRAELTLLGHSFGGVHVVAAASLRPELVDRVVDLDAVARPPTPRPLPPSGVVAARAGHGSPPTLPSYASLEDMAARRAAANPRLDTELLHHLARLLGVERDGRWSWRVDPLLTGWARPWDAAPGAPGDPVPTLVTLPQPTLVVTGSGEDHPLIRGPYPGDAALVGHPGLRHVRLPDAGHYVHLEQPVAVAAAVAALVEEGR